jgi:hypothetical protein
MGGTGTGKSSFIAEVTGKRVQIGHDLHSCKLFKPTKWVLDFISSIRYSRMHKLRVSPRRSEYRDTCRYPRVLRY